jgi:hypothetical protein
MLKILEWEIDARDWGGDLDDIEREVERQRGEMAIERDKILASVKKRLKGGGDVLH